MTQRRRLSMIHGSRTRRGPRLARVAIGIVAFALAVTSCVLDGAWTLTVPAPVTSSAIRGEKFFDVSCPATDFCMAVGSDQPMAPFPSITTIVQIWDGTTWSDLPFASSAPGRSLLWSVSCTSPNACLVGWEELILDWEGYVDASYPRFSRWNGASWTLLAGSDGDPRPAAGGCAADGSCVMAIRDQPTVVWDGLTAEARAGSVSPHVADLDCRSADACIGVGGGGDEAYRWDGASWTAIPIPVPPVGSHHAWRSVSCTAATRCVAVGMRYGQWPDVWQVPAAASFDGIAWTVRELPDVGEGRLDAVSCADALACVAVGSLGSSSNPEDVAMAWNGGTWYLAADPSTVAGASLRSVGCTTGAPTCVAVGHAGPNTRTVLHAVRYDWNAPPPAPSE